jgi:hypothetical protein
VLKQRKEQGLKGPHEGGGDEPETAPDDDEGPVAPVLPTGQAVSNGWAFPRPDI